MQNAFWQTLDADVTVRVKLCLDLVAVPLATVVVIWPFIVIYMWPFMWPVALQVKTESACSVRQ